jgi:hypothetical protein
VIKVLRIQIEYGQRGHGVVGWRDCTGQGR